MQSLGASETPTILPGVLDARSSLHQPHNNLGNNKPGVACRVDKHSRGSLQKASFQAQELAESFPVLDRTATASKGKSLTRSLSETTLPQHLALEESTRQLQQQVPPPTQLWHVVSQLRAEIVNLQLVVRHLAELTFSKVPPTLGAELGEEEVVHNKTNNNNNNNNTNNDNDHNKNIQESGLGSLDLDDDNPESSLSGSEQDLDESSLESFVSEVESSLGSSDQHDEDLSLDNLGHQTMTIESSLGSLDQEDSDQEGMIVESSWDPSLDQHRDSFGNTKPKKRVTFSEATLAAYNERAPNNRKQQNKGSHPTSSQLEQLEHKEKNSKKEDEWSKTTRACWSEPQQEHQQMQQQTATALNKEMEHRPCTNNSLDGEDQSLGSLESQTQTEQACRSPKHNNNTSSLGQVSKNTSAWGIMIDTGAAISLAPMSFAPETELSPLESTLQLRSVTGRAIPAFGRRAINLIGSQLSFRVSFVIADVEHALLGMDIFMQEQLSLQRGSNNEHYLVNIAGEQTQLQQRGHHLYLEACPCESGLITCMRSSLPQENGSLLDDEDSDQDAASQEDLGNCEVSASGGARGTSFFPENLRQQQDKNTTSLGTTALPEQGARRRRRKKPSARTASHDQLVERSSKQKGQTPAATQLRTNSEKTSLIKEIELAAEDGKESLSNIERQELSLRILLTLSLRNERQIATTRATTACSEDVLGQQLRSIGLEKNKMGQNIFSGDELVIMIRKNSLLIGGTELQQECLFTELSALISLEQTTKLDQDTPVSFCNKTLEYNVSSHSISLSLPTTFYMELLQRHDLEDVEPTSRLEEQELSHQDASEQNNTALNAGRQELYKKTVGDLVWAATACRPDLSSEVHLLTQSLTAPTRAQERQLHRVLSYIKGTLHYTLSLHPTNKRAEEKAQSLELPAFSASSWTEACRPTSTAYLTLWGVPLIASCRTSCAYKQADAELASVRLALGLASHTKSLLQHLGVDQLEEHVNISLKTSSLNVELVTGRPLAIQLGLSRRNKHIQLRSEKGQLQLSKNIQTRILLTA